jgi:uncharacterized membrane protein YvbJ
MIDGGTFTCPHCGEEIKKSSKACPYCGSDESTGWSQDRYLDGIDLPENDEYEEIRDREFGKGRRNAFGKLWLVITGTIVIVVFLTGIFMMTR